MGFEDLCKKVTNINGHNRYFASFSLGADSITALLRVRETEIIDTYNGILYYYYMMPDIGWINEYIEYIQKKLEIKIIQMPSPHVMDCYIDGVYQSPHLKAGITELQKTDDFIPAFNKNHLSDIVRDEYNINNSLESVGIKSGDSPDRRIYLRKCEGINIEKKKWFPIWDYENRDVIDIIKRHDIKMPICYRLSGISTEQIDYRFIEPLRKYYTAGYEDIKKYFPLIEWQKLRIWRFKPEYLQAKKGVFYGKFDCLFPDGLNEENIPIERREKKKRDKTETGNNIDKIRAFRNKFKDRWDFEGDMSSCIHLVFPDEETRNKWAIGKVVLINDLYCFDIEIESYIKTQEKKRKSEFDIDVDFDINIDLDFGIAEDKKDDSIFTNYDITKQCKDELYQQFGIVKDMSEKWLKDNDIDGSGKYWITIIFENSEKKRNFIDNKNLNDYIEYNDILQYKNVKEG